MNYHLSTCSEALVFKSIVQHTIHTVHKHFQLNVLCSVSRFCTTTLAFASRCWRWLGKDPLDRSSNVWTTRPKSWSPSRSFATRKGRNKTFCFWMCIQCSKTLKLTFLCEVSTDRSSGQCSKGVTSVLLYQSSLKWSNALCVSMEVRLLLFDFYWYKCHQGLMLFNNAENKMGAYRRRAALVSPLGPCLELNPLKDPVSPGRGDSPFFAAVIIFHTKVN